jgi:hypothetical protein
MVSLCTSAAARAPLPALWAGAAGACDGAADGESLLAAAGSDEVSAGFSDGTSVGASMGAGGGEGGGAGGADIGLTGLTGDSGFVGFVTDLVHESPAKFHWPQTAWPYGSGQTLWRL